MKRDLPATENRHLPFPYMKVSFHKLSVAVLYIRHLLVSDYRLTRCVTVLSVRQISLPNLQPIFHLEFYGRCGSIRSPQNKQGETSQKTVIRTLTSMRTSNIICFVRSLYKVPITHKSTRFPKCNTPLQ
jgi:hypothetical protein